MSLLNAVTDAIGSVITWVGTVITSLTTAGTAQNPTLNALLPLFAIGIAISAVLLGIYEILSSERRVHGSAECGNVCY